MKSIKFGARLEVLGRYGSQRGDSKVCSHFVMDEVFNEPEC